MTFTPEVWDGVLRRLRHELPSFSYEAWLATLEYHPNEAGVVLVCESTFHRERIREYHLARIAACLREEAGVAADTEIRIELGVRARRAEAVQDTAVQVGAVTAGPATPGRRERGIVMPREARRATREHPPRPRRRAPHAPGCESDAPPVRYDGVGAHAGEERGTMCARQGVQTGEGALDGAGAERAAGRGEAAEAAVQPGPHTFETFVVGPCNALAREAALALARGRQRTLSQLYLCSAAGMGKTHLSRAVAAEAARSGASSVQYLSAEAFTNQFMSALRANRTGEFKRRYRGTRQLLVVEDVQFLERKDATQLEFFHTVAHVLDTGGRVVVTGDRMPGQMPHLSQRLRAQLIGGFVAELEAPDAQVRRSILRAKAAHGGWRLPMECVDLLVETVQGSVRDLEGALIQLVTTAALLGRPIDLDLTRAAIAKKCTPRIAESSRLSVDAVVGTVASFFQTTPERLASRSRKQQILVPRQLAMYLCRRYTDATVAEIGQVLGRDHPSVRNAIERMERAILEKPKLRYQVEAVIERLERLRRGE